jgi:uncharacterized protein involved in exopolysaccharide biosynthesis
MSRIDEALKRLSGGAVSETRPSSVLDRYASEAAARADEPKKASRADDVKITSFASQGAVAVDSRALAPRISPVTSTAVPRVQSPAPGTVAKQDKDNGKGDKEKDKDNADEVDKLIDVRQVVDYVGFVLRSVVRHKLLWTSTVLVILLVAVITALVIPRTYFVEVKLLAQRNAVMAALSNPGRAVPWDADAPTRAAAETVLRRDNLISLIAQTDLVKEWDARRAPIQKFKDWVRAVVTRHQPTMDEKLDALVYRLENAMVVSAGPIGDGTVTIALYWPDAEMAYKLVERAQQAFLDARQIAETSAINEAIAILERYSTSLHKDVNQTLLELQQTTARERVAGPSARVPARVAPRRYAVTTLAKEDNSLDAPADIDRSMAADPEAAKVKGELLSKRTELAKIQSERERTISEMQAKLAALQTVYTASHPSVQTLQQNIAMVQKESPQLAALKASVEQLETKYDELAAAEAERVAKAELNRRQTTPATSRVETSEPAQAEAPPPVPVEPVPSQAAQFASLRLRTELSQLQSILERTDGARIELAVSEAAFKYRYTVIKPAQVPREPQSPQIRLLLAGAFVLSLVLGLAATVTKDLMSDRVLEPWQVERRLGLPILGSVNVG